MTTESTTWQPDTDSIERRIRDLCALGNRFVGTLGEIAARKMIFEEFAQIGLTERRLEEFTVTGYQPAGASCEVVGVTGVEIPTAGLQFSASGDVTARVVSLGSAHSVEEIEELERFGLQIEGRIAIIDTDQPDFLCGYLRDRGAVGIMVISHNPDGHITHGVVEPRDGVYLDIPGVIVERKAASKVTALLLNGFDQLRIKHEATSDPVDTANIVGVVAGTELPNEYVVLGAHYDTQMEGVGAQDNATGVAALLEIAKKTVAEPRRRTMVFVAFGNEEFNTNGAAEYCRRHHDELADTAAMICLDALAWKYPSKRSLRADPSMQAYALERCREAGWEPEEVLDARKTYDSDHNIFISSGVPAAWIWHSTPQHPGYHSPGDTPDMLDYPRVAETAGVIAHLAFALADDSERLERAQSLDGVTTRAGIPT